jgi:hypothetical protein
MHYFIWLLFIVACTTSRAVTASSAQTEELKSPTALTSSEKGDAMAQQVERGGMSVRWYVEGGDLFVTMKAPTAGWVAVGFNTQPTLEGSLLILGAVEDGKVRVEEHIAQPPKHPTRISLGGRSALRRFEAQEQDRETQVSFVLGLSLQDQIAPVLSLGASVYLTLAFSQEDDFQHHSIMRTSVQITL